jgi:hypothetical protein
MRYIEASGRCRHSPALLASFSPQPPVPTTIRTFRNTDAEAICRVWNAHYAEQGTDAQMLPLALELGCLAKPFFDKQDLIIAEVNEQVVGFAHASRSTIQETTEQIHPLAIVALCVAPQADDAEIGDAEIAAQLLRHCEQIAERLSIDQIRFKPMLPNGGFYLGYGPADSMIGTTTSEQRTCQWLRAAGFQPLQPTNLWELELSRFQPPVDRMQLQIRRTAHVDRQVDEPLLPWWQACVLGHTEAAAFQLTDRTEKRVLLEVLYWTVAPELQLTPHSVAWLWPPELSIENSRNAQAPGPSDQMVFLIAESIRELQGESVDVIRTVSSADHAPMSQLLRRLGFKPIQSGLVFHKQLGNAPRESEPAS